MAACKLAPVHPGEMLREEFMKPLGLTISEVARRLRVPPNRISQLVQRKRAMTADTALRLSQYFGMSADFWMNLQSAYELDLARQQSGKAIKRIPKRSQIAEPRPAA